MPDRPVFVTGAAGFIGSTLAEALLRSGRSVIGVDNFNDYYDPARKRSHVESIRHDPRFSLHEVDIRDTAVMRELFSRHRPRAVAHLAAYGGVRYSIGRAPLYADVNITGSINLLEAARETEPEVFVFASTSSVYGHAPPGTFVETDPCDRPLAPYPASKRAVELLGYTYHNLHGLNFTAVRLFSVYGPRGRPDMMPFIMTDRIARGEKITLFEGGCMKRDWTYVDDVVSGLMVALDRPLGCEIINLGRGDPVLMTDMVRMIEDLIGAKADLDTSPAPSTEPKVTVANIDKARRLLGYEPRTSVEEGLERLWQWYQKHVAVGSRTI